MGGCGCEGNPLQKATASPYLSIISNPEQSAILANARCKQAALLYDATELGRKGFPEYQLNGERRANQIAQMLFTLERGRCLTQSEINKLFLLLQRETEGYVCNDINNTDNGCECSVLQFISAVTPTLGGLTAPLAYSYMLLFDIGYAVLSEADLELMFNTTCKTTTDATQLLFCQYAKLRYYCGYTVEQVLHLDTVGNYFISISFCGGINRGISVTFTQDDPTFNLGLCQLNKYFTYAAPLPDFIPTQTVITNPNKCETVAGISCSPIILPC